jgi:hypothetical protein
MNQFWTPWWQYLASCGAIGAAILGLGLLMESLGW